MTGPARRAISELLAEDVAAAAVEFITGPLLEAPYRVGKPLRDTLSGFHSAWLGTQWRVLYRIGESKACGHRSGHPAPLVRLPSPVGPWRPALASGGQVTMNLAARCPQGRRQMSASHTAI